MANQYFTAFSQQSFALQFVITFVVTVILFFKYKNDWYNFEKLFFSFFVLITISNLLAIFFITEEGISYALVVVFSNSALVVLLIAGESLLGVQNKVLLYILPILIFVFDALVNLLYAISFTGLDVKIYRAITGIDILLFTIPSLIMYSYLLLKTKDISIGFFILALVLYLAGGFSLTSLHEQGMAVFYISAVVCFALATLIPIVRDRLQTYSKEASLAK